MEYTDLPAGYVNVHPVERLASIGLGGFLTITGLRRGRGGIPWMLVGTAMIQRGVSGECPVYRALGVRSATNSSKAAVPYELGIRARAAVTINKPRHEVFTFWRNLENLPQFMRHLESVQRHEEGHSHWVARGPGNSRIHWDAEIINETPDELIAWKSLPDSMVNNAGSVRFNDAPGGRGTEVHVELQYDPPAGVLGAQIARLMGREPEQQIESDLGRLKQYFESGELATTEGQPHGGQVQHGRRGERSSKWLPEEVIA